MSTAEHNNIEDPGAGSHQDTIVVGTNIDSEQHFLARAAIKSDVSQIKPPSAFREFATHHETSLIFFGLVLLDLIVSPAIILLGPHLGGAGFVLVWFLLFSIPGGIICLLIGLITFASELAHKK